MYVCVCVRRVEMGGGGGGGEGEMRFSVFCNLLLHFLFYELLPFRYCEQSD